jgi:hypothetical protein
MWILTTLGFFSVVAAPRRTGHVMIRARKRADLEVLLRRFGRRCRIYMTPDADYPCRVVVSSKTWVAWVRALATDAVHVTNFKAAVHDVNPQRAETYHRVWFDLREIEVE